MSNNKNTRSGLGKGLDALFDSGNESIVELAYGKETVHQIPLQFIVPNKDQPRRHFDEAGIQELAISIKEFGILQPLVVTKIEQNKYSIIAGERRWRAAKIAKQTTVPVIIRSASELQVLEMALIENVQREDLSPLDQALSIERLHDQFSLSYESIAAKLGKAYSTVANSVRLLQLSPDIQEALKDKAITEGHARALLSLQSDKESQDSLFNLIIKDHLSVRQAEQFVVAKKEKRTSSNHAVARTKSSTKETKRLTKHLGVDVSVSYLAKGGKLQIRFKDQSEYQKLVDRLLKA